MYGAFPSQNLLGPKMYLLYLLHRLAEIPMLVLWLEVYFQFIYLRALKLFVRRIVYIWRVCCFLERRHKRPLVLQYSLYFLVSFILISILFDSKQIQQQNLGLCTALMAEQGRPAPVKVMRLSFSMTLFLVLPSSLLVDIMAQEGKDNTKYICIYIYIYIYCSYTLQE